MKTIDEILKNYDKRDYKLVKETIDELCRNGVGKGCYQDYGVLSDVIEVLAYFEDFVKNTMKDFENDNDFITNISNVDTDELFKQLEWYGCDSYYTDLWRAVIEELKKRVKGNEND